MTTLQKIVTLNWFDFLKKLKVILTELNSTKVYPVYANNSGALAGGLKVNEIYRTSLGNLNVVV